MAERYVKIEGIPKVGRDTPGSLFKSVVELVKEHGHFQEAEPILDYVLPEGYDTRKLTNYRFSFQAIVNPGGSEGIYIDCVLRGEFDRSGEKYCQVGTIKTLREDVDAYRIMGALAGLLTVYAYKYINNNLDRYTPDTE